MHNNFQIFQTTEKYKTSLHLHMVIVLLKITYPHVQTVTHLAPKRNCSNSIEQKTIIGVTHIAANGQTESLSAHSSTPLFDDCMYVVCTSKKKMRTDFHQNDNCSTFLQMCYAPDAQLH